MVDRFNQVSYWVSSEVVMQTDLKKRQTLLKKFITIAEQMKEIGNFNGLMEIIGGLNSMPVHRLKSSWEQVPKNLTDSFAQLNLLMDNINNYSNYRNAIKNANLPALPYLGVYLRDVIFLDEGNLDFVDKEKKLLNFEKLQLLGSTFCDVKRFQSRAFTFYENESLTACLKNLPVLPEEILYKHSLICESNPGSSDGAAII